MKLSSQLSQLVQIYRSRPTFCTWQLVFLDVCACMCVYVLSRAARARVCERARSRVCACVRVGVCGCVRAGDSVSARVLCFSVCQFRFVLYDVCVCVC